MRSPLTIAAIMTVLMTLPARTRADVPEGPVEVFILAGQSNMEGHGKVEWGRDPNYDPNLPGAKREILGGLGCLRRLATDPKTVDRYKHLMDADGKWVVRDDVWVYSTTDGGEKGRLTVGFGAGVWFGPELGFGHVVGDRIKGPVLIIKTAWGGKSLGVDFRPPSSGKPPYTKYDPEQVGKYYREMMAIVKDVRNNLDTYFPELAMRRSIRNWREPWPRSKRAASIGPRNNRHRSSGITGNITARAII